MVPHWHSNRHHRLHFTGGPALHHRQEPRSARTNYQLPNRNFRQNGNTNLGPTQTDRATHRSGLRTPEQKLAIVRRETAAAKTLYVGDGINDAPAMMAATVGMGVGQNSDVTAEAADAVSMENSLKKWMNLCTSAGGCVPLLSRARLAAWP